MEVFSTVTALQDRISSLKKNKQTIGLVPTMGALHNGHVSLVNQSKQKCDYTIVSIFVNPTQFNNSSDLEKYPRTFEKDLNLLEESGVDFIFHPSVEEIYPQNYTSPEIDLGILDKVMEGKFRNGHFQGVVEVVKRLFEICMPDFSYFGQKDFQQVAVIKFMTNYFNLPVEIIECPIIRTNEGLAMSSRNMRLSQLEQQQSLVIYRALTFAKENINRLTPIEIIQECTNLINDSGLTTEYVEIVNSLTLESLSNDWNSNTVCCIAAYCGEVRLIDNMVLINDFKN